MTWLQAILLGALQGLTEFLPVSSSGHLVLLQHIFGLYEPALIFDLFVHIATLFAVLMMYRHDIRKLVTAWFLPPASASSAFPNTEAERASARRLGLFLLLANIPTACLGLMFESTFEQFFATPQVVGLALLGTGTLLWCLKSMAGEKNGTTEIGLRHTLLLGCVQGLAITPGISRSGSTIAAALLCGIPPRGRGALFLPDGHTCHSGGRAPQKQWSERAVGRRDRSCRCRDAECSCRRVCGPAFSHPPGHTGHILALRRLIVGVSAWWRSCSRCRHSLQPQHAEVEASSYRKKWQAAWSARL